MENVKLTLPKQCFLQYVPVDEENVLQVMVDWTGNKRQLTFIQETANTEIETQEKEPGKSVSVLVMPAAFRFGYELAYFIQG